jgi:3',5'-cyclic AMP phosphodiesterase CpdA
MSGSFLLAQISDIHIRTDDDGVSIAQFLRALRAAERQQPDVILLTGDLANNEGEAEYAALAEALAGIATPLFVLPGNHDHRARMRAAFPGAGHLPASDPMSYVIDDFPVRIVMVDQIVPGETHGELTEPQAEWLDAALREAPSKPTIVALHHPPIRTYDRLFDDIGLRDADLLADVVSRHRQVERIVCGHHHRVAFGQCAHAPVIVAPSTSWSYGLALHADQPIAPRTSEPCGWMLHVRGERGFASHFMGF